MLGLQGTNKDIMIIILWYVIMYTSTTMTIQYIIDNMITSTVCPTVQLLTLTHSTESNDSV